MYAMICGLLCATLPPAEANPHGFLWTYTPDGKGGMNREVIPYEPREGDWLFFDDMSKWWTFLYAIADTAPPFHAGIVVKRPDGSLAVLESGPDDTLLEDKSSPDSAEPPLPVESVEAGSSSDEEFAAALRRITELSEVEPTKRRSLRSLVVSRLRRRGAPSDF